MPLNEQQEKLCDTNPYNFEGMSALFLNCTLKKSPELSHTEGLWKISKAILEKNKVQIDEIRIVDHDIAFVFLPEFHRQRNNLCDRFGVFAVDVKNRDLQHFSHIGRIGGRPAVVW